MTTGAARHDRRTLVPGGRILVTGANGFIGKALCCLLATRGYRVRGVVRGRNSTAGSGPVRQKRASGLDHEEGQWEWLSIGDVGPDTVWTRALSDVSVVVHLAARVHVMKDYARDPLNEFRRVNVAGTARLARSAAAAGVERIVFASSVKVNGEVTRSDMSGRNLAFVEESAPAPQDEYGQSKWEAEQVLHRVGVETGLEIVILRPPVVYGPRVRGNFLHLLRAIRTGIPIPLGGVKNTRSLIYLGNLTDVMAMCLFHPKAAGRTYLVSDGDDVSTPELVRRVASALGSSARLMRVPVGLLHLVGRLTGKSAEIDRLVSSLVIDGSRIRRELGWEPPYTMWQGLSDTARWFKSLE